MACSAQEVTPLPVRCFIVLFADSSDLPAISFNVVDGMLNFIQIQLVSGARVASCSWGTVTEDSSNAGCPPTAESSTHSTGTVIQVMESWLGFGV